MNPILAQKLRIIVAEELEKVGGITRGDEILIKCPFHDDSNPSLNVHIGHKVAPGTFNCWSCPASGGWNKLAYKLNLRTVEYDTESKITESDDPFRLILSEIQSTPKEKGPEVLKGLEDLPPGFTHRGLTRKFYKKIGASFFWDRKRDLDYLHLPLFVGSEYLGYTLIKVSGESKLKYLTMAPTNKAILLYNYLKEGEPVILTEGHFDALRLFHLGLPAVAIFGTENWSDIKKSLITLKRPSKVYVMMDGDQPGYLAAEEIATSIKDGLDTEIIKLPLDYDPGNLTEDMDKWLIEKVNSDAKVQKFPCQQWKSL